MLTVHAAPGRRAGFTLIELVIAMVLMSLVGSAIVSLLLRQQRFYNSTTDLIQTRQQIRQAAAMLPSDLRGISSIGGDIYSMSDSALEFRSVFGGSVVCANIGGQLSTVPRVLATGATMTNWATIPVVGDSLAVYNNGPTLAVADDGWSLSRITAMATVSTNVANGCPTTTGLTRAGDISAANPSYQLTLSPAAANTIAVGAAIRFFRRVRYRIYRETDNQWYLGFFNCLFGRVPVCNTTQPIAGPFQPYANNATSGAQFVYYDSTGAVTANPLQVARISLVVRGQSAGLVNLSGAGGTVFHDSLRIEVGLRNRK
jgi:prepilin-type N-terminal cleavage/methylation domain-containing protein